MFNLILAFVFPLPVLLYTNIFLCFSCQENLSLLLSTQQKGESSGNMKPSVKLAASHTDLQ